MDLLIRRVGHIVYLRQPDSLSRWEAACDCGYRSERTDRAEAEKAGLLHAEQAPEVKVKKAPKKVRTYLRVSKKPKRKK